MNIIIFYARWRSLDKMRVLSASSNLSYLISLLVFGGHMD